MSTVLEVEDLRLHYLTRFGARIQAVDGVSFTLREGEILGIAGESVAARRRWSALMGSSFRRSTTHPATSASTADRSSVSAPSRTARGARPSRRHDPQGALNFAQPHAQDQGSCRRHDPESRTRRPTGRLSTNDCASASFGSGSTPTKSSTPTRSSSPPAPSSASSSASRRCSTRGWSSQTSPLRRSTSRPRRR